MLTESMPSCSIPRYATAYLWGSAMLFGTKVHSTIDVATHAHTLTQPNGHTH